ncbi:DNA polymerase III subunit delta' [Leucobacter sp. Psy1]|uniref:DNA polymerase III subunit delta' n=1 Tax=Leucobacter sp. Psy1 TaxID=2875729 RepID=UPI001CD69928|nr:DNA polymerase III subunit delta' [Leucobacter sp. Psy1]UBH07266.1 DNA polymerase III subunit delta' [Leucobacter sp. Psy1]
MDHWAEIVGQTAAVEALERAASPEGAGELAHAWLITGPPGSGRSNIAERFAAALIAREVDERAKIFDQVRARTHPDYALLTTQAVTIRVDDVREFIKNAYYAPAEGRHRVIVIEDADRMPERTSNVLLKVLEEPPERTIWILCAPSEADLLPTIRSRTRSLRLVTPSTADVAHLLHVRDGIDTAAAERAARLSQNHIGMARRLATSPEALERRSRSIAAALAVTTLGDAMRAASELLKVAEADAAALTEQLDAREREEAMRNLGLEPGAAIPPQLRGQIKALEEDQKRRATRSLRDGIDRVLTDLLSLYRDVLLTAISVADTTEGSALINTEERERIVELAERWGPRRALAAVDALEEARLRLSRAVTPGLVLEALFAGLIVDPAGAE